MKKVAVTLEIPDDMEINNITVLQSGECIFTENGFLSGDCVYISLQQRAPAK